MLNDRLREGAGDICAPRPWREGAARLGVRTIEGDFERALVADVLKALRAVGVDELQAPRGLHRLVAVEDVGRLVGAIGLPRRG